MTMLRRRRKTMKEPAPAPRGAGHSRRRARPDAVVPPQLKVPAHVEAVVKGEARAVKSPRPSPQKPSNRGSEPVVLVAGFEPFGGESVNPAWQVCERLPRSIGALRVEVVRVPCEFRRAIEVAAAAIERHRPSLVIAVGQAGGRTHVGVERVAINVDDARTADNAGAQPIDEPIAADGPPAYFATVPVKAVVAAIRAAGVPAEVSNSAGTYVCNHLMYGILHLLAHGGHAARAGFIHVPYAEEQVLAKPGTPSMSLASMVKAVEAAIAAAASRTQDVRLAGGALD